MKYIIIGLGNYGRKLAEELAAIGHEVIGVDSDESRVDAIKDKITTAFEIDATDKHSLSVLPLKDIDVVVVAIGENFGASVRVVALLKQLKVQHIYARAIDSVHRSVLEAFSLDRILTPEEDAACQLVQQIEFDVNADFFQIDADYCVVKFSLPKRFIGYSVNELKWDEEFKVKILGVVRGTKVENCIGVSIFESHVVNELLENDIILENDGVVCYGKYSDFQRLWKALK